MTNPELKAEYEMLKTTHSELIQERTDLRGRPGDGAGYRDYHRKLQTYMKALDAYLAARGHRG